MGKAERFFLRIGLIVGAAGFVLLALAQLAWAFAAVLLLALVALGAGLATAKWLPRALYGKQFITGIRAGALACGIASIGLLIALAVSSHASVDVLAQRSHLLGFQLASAAHSLRVLGPFGVAFVLLLIGSAAGTLLAGMSALLGAWDKNQRAIRVIDRARQRAQRGTGHTPLGVPSSGKARPTGAMPIFPVYPPGGALAPDGTPLPSAPEAAGYATPQPGTGQATVLHDALAAWADGPNRQPAPPPTQDEPTRPKREGGPASRPASDRDNWLC